MKGARGNIEQLLDLPHVQTAGEGGRFWRQLDSVMADADPRGNLVGDAHIVALMLDNGVRSIWTHDRDYTRIKGIDVRDPFVET